MAKAAIYTKQGDAGKTGLSGGIRLSKIDQRICALGSIDELNAVLGVAVCSSTDDQVEFLQGIQRDLLTIGASLSLAEVVFDAEQITAVEETIDALTEQLEPLRNFIIPGGKPLAAMFHYVRTVCRRAERDLVALAEQTDRCPTMVDPNILIYLNRLSDLFFVYARWHNDQGKGDIIWQSKVVSYGDFAIAIPAPAGVPARVPRFAGQYGGRC